MIATLWLAILATLVAFYRVDVRTAALSVPYLLWVSSSGYLNYAFRALN